MIAICKCPACGAEKKIDKPSGLPVITCLKCGHKAHPDKFEEVMKTVYCPKCGAPHKFRQDQRPRTIKCTKCGFGGRTADYTDIPAVKKGPDDLTDTRLPNGDSGKMYRPGKLHLHRDEGGWTGVVREFELVRGQNTLGRQSPASRSSIQFPTADNYMSKNHAAIDVDMKTDSTFEHILKDNGSVNGTFHNDTRLDPADETILTHGDTVRMGRTTFVFMAKQ